MTARDWRGTEITPGALVIYGAPVGRSIAMVEARVGNPMLTPSGRIWLEVERRSYGGWGDGKRRVHVGPSRLTVVTGLPPTDMPTDVEKHAQEKAQRDENSRRLASHQVDSGRPDMQPPTCARCGDSGYPALMAQECAA